MLKLVKCTTKSELYHKAFVHKLESALRSNKELNTTDVMSISFLGVKVYSRFDKKGMGLEDLMIDFENMEIIKGFMALLTPRQFMNTFPITKVYDGDKYETKDYPYTMNMIKEMGIDKPIEDRMDKFLWDYLNRDISMFLVNLMSITRDIMRANGQQGLLKHMSAEFGIPIYLSDDRQKTITGPILVEKEDGEYYHNDSEAQTVPFKKPKPDFIKVVKK